MLMHQYQKGNVNGINGKEKGTRKGNGNRNRKIGR